MYAALDVPNRKGKKARTLHELKESKFGEKSELLEKERNITTKNILLLQETFWEIHFLRKPNSEFGIEPFDPVRIESHLKLLGKTLSKWEYKVLLEMDLAYRATVMNNQ